CSYSAGSYSTLQQSSLTVTLVVQSQSSGGGGGSGEGAGGGGGGNPLWKALPARVFVTAADAGGGPDVKALAADGTFVDGFFAYDQHFTGGVRVAVGDVNGDGSPDVICAAGPGGGPNVLVLNGKDGSTLYNF